MVCLDYLPDWIRARRAEGCAVVPLALFACAGTTLYPLCDAARYLPEAPAGGDDDSGVVEVDVPDGEITRADLRAAVKGFHDLMFSAKHGEAAYISQMMLLTQLDGNDTRTIGGGKLGFMHANLLTRIWHVDDLTIALPEKSINDFWRRFVVENGVARGYAVEAKYAGRSRNIGFGQAGAETLEGFDLTFARRCSEVDVISVVRHKKKAEPYGLVFAAAELRRDILQGRLYAESRGKSHAVLDGLTGAPTLEHFAEGEAPDYVFADPQYRWRAASAAAKFFGTLWRLDGDCYVLVNYDYAGAMSISVDLLEEAAARGVGRGRRCALGEIATTMDKVYAESLAAGEARWPRTLVEEMRVARSKERRVHNDTVVDVQDLLDALYAQCYSEGKAAAAVEVDGLFVPVCVVARNLSGASVGLKLEASIDAGPLYSGQPKPREKRRLLAFHAACAVVRIVVAEDWAEAHGIAAWAVEEPLFLVLPLSADVVGDLHRNTFVPLPIVVAALEGAGGPIDVEWGNQLGSRARATAATETAIRHGFCRASRLRAKVFPLLREHVARLRAEQARSFWVPAEDPKDWAKQVAAVKADSAAARDARRKRKSAKAFDVGAAKARRDVVARYAGLTLARVPLKTHVTVVSHGTGDLDAFTRLGQCLRTMNERERRDDAVDAVLQRAEEAEERHREEDEDAEEDEDEDARVARENTFFDVAVEADRDSDDDPVVGIVDADYDSNDDDGGAGSDTPESSL